MLETLFEKLHRKTEPAFYSTKKREDLCTHLVNSLNELLNTRQNSLITKENPLLQHSLLFNQGLPDLSQFNPSADNDKKILLECIEHLIALHEPRLENVKINLLDPSDPLEPSLHFVISAEIHNHDENIFFHLELNPLSNKLYLEKIQ